MDNDMKQNDNEPIVLEPAVTESDLAGASDNVVRTEVDNSDTAPLDPEQEIERLKGLLEISEDKALRARADAENVRQRSIKEMSEGIKYASKSLLTDLLPVLDSLELALQHLDSGDTSSGTSNSELASLRDGVTLTLKQFVGALAKHGIDKLEPEIGAAFDPNFHEGLMIENNPELGDNTVSGILQTGYTLNTRVIRPAKVKVNKK